MNFEAHTYSDHSNLQYNYQRNKTTGLGIFPFLPGKKKNPYISNDFWKHKIKQAENRLRCDQKPIREGSNPFCVTPVLLLSEQSCERL